jgi:hypothetical protein
MGRPQLHPVDRRGDRHHPETHGALIAAAFAVLQSGGAAATWDWSRRPALFEVFEVA